MGCTAAARSSPAHRAASPGREMERDRLKAEPEAWGQRAARLCHSGCTARPFRLRHLRPVAPPVQSKEPQEETPSSVLQRPWHLQLAVAHATSFLALGDEIHPWEHLRQL